MPNILTPIGRLVAGSVYTANDKDYQGNPLTIKTGPNMGQPRIEYFFALAIPKQGERHWAETPWGNLIWTVGHQAFPHGEAQRPDFSWKIIDGDSTIPNKRNVTPVSKPGYAGHWVLNFSSSFAPKLYNANGTQQLVEPNAIQPGYYIQVAGTVDGNKNSANPGVYLNHSMVALAAYGEVINLGPDPTQVGFGNAPLPPGASAAPVGAQFNPAGQYAPPPPQGAPYVPPAPPAPQGAPYAPPAPQGVPGMAPYLNGPNR